MREIIKHPDKTIINELAIKKLILLSAMLSDPIIKAITAAKKLNISIYFVCCPLS